MVLGEKVLLENILFLALCSSFWVMISQRGCQCVDDSFQFCKDQGRFQLLLLMGEQSDFPVIVPSSGTGAASWAVASFS